MKSALGKIIKTNILAVICILIMSLMLYFIRDINIILSFVILMVAYLIIGVVIEMIIEKVEISSAKTFHKKQERIAETKATEVKEEQKTTLFSGNDRQTRIVPSAQRNAEIKRKLIKTQMDMNIFQMAEENKDATAPETTETQDDDIKLKPTKIFSDGETVTKAAANTERVKVISNVNELYKKDFSRILEKTATERDLPDMKFDDNIKSTKLEEVEDSKKKSRMIENEFFGYSDDMDLPDTDSMESESAYITREIEKRISSHSKEKNTEEVSYTGTDELSGYSYEDIMAVEAVLAGGVREEKNVIETDDAELADIEETDDVFEEPEITEEADEIIIEDEDSDDAECFSDSDPSDEIQEGEEEYIAPESFTEEPVIADNEPTEIPVAENLVVEVAGDIKQPETNNIKKAVPFKTVRKVKYKVPTTDLLRSSSKKSESSKEENDQVQKAKAVKLEQTLASFGVKAKVINIISGPAVTRFEIQPDQGVKVSKITSLADDIALNLASVGIRIEAPIPGKAAVGIEIPNSEVDIVYLKEVIDSEEYKNSQSKLSFAIGKDIAGKNIIADIAKMPHLLIAGATGSGKSVCINTIVASILFKADPNEVRLIMVDPKVVELGIYNGIPHLLVPVVTDPKKAAGALSWAIEEMEKRYRMFSQHNVRDIKSFNALCKNSDSEEMIPMPQIVIIIDELADLMMVASKEIEDSIIRLSQKARAAGIHLVIATQRPSVDVITGLIKANIPSRIAFAVSSYVDSRTILDSSGAEKLLGRGDMLFYPVGQPKPLRVQGAFVSDGEIEALVEHIKESYGTVEYSKEIEESISNAAADNNKKTAGSVKEDDDDEDADLVEAAAELAFLCNGLSASFLQRKLRLGYSRASRIIDVLESKGLLSPADGSKPRQVIMSREEWENRN